MPVKRFAAVFLIIHANVLMPFMNAVIAPIDFSDASINALAFAAELSKRASAPLLVANILDESADEQETKNRLKTIESDLKNTFGSDLNCESLVAHGNLVSTLTKIIEVHQPALIVMGTK